MVHGVLSTSAHFAKRADWFAPLLSQKGFRLAGPILIATERLKGKAPGVASEAARLANSFPHRLHLSEIETDLTFEALVEHLRAFVYFGDTTGQTCGLRIADCRVLAYLPHILAPAQWNAMTEPVVAWRIHDRTGKKGALSLDPARKKSIANVLPLRLSDEQIDALMDAGEPDALLMRLGKEPEAVNSTDVQRCYRIAKGCIERWKADGGKDRGILMDMAKENFRKTTKK